MERLCDLVLAGALLQLLLLSHATAQQYKVVDVKFNIDPRDLFYSKVNTALTVSFAPTTMLPAGGNITITTDSLYGRNFYSPSSAPTMLSCSLPQLLVSLYMPPHAASIIATTSGSNISSGSAFTITIVGLTMRAAPTTAEDNIAYFGLETTTDTSRVHFLWDYAFFRLSETSVSQFSMTIAVGDRVWGAPAPVTISFTPSTTLLADSFNTRRQFIVLWFPAGFFSCVNLENCLQGISFKSSISNSYFRATDFSSSWLAFLNEAQSSSFPPGASIPANTVCTITIFGLKMGSPVGSAPNSVFLTTGKDSAANPNIVVDSGYIGIGSYVNGSCPYGMTWDSAQNSCTVCNVMSGTGLGLICDDFLSCTRCISCPYGQSITASFAQAQTDTNSWSIKRAVYYACSSGTSKCPPGSGKVKSSNGQLAQGCANCLADQYNDGSSETCRTCPTGTFPNYHVKKSSNCDTLNNKNCLLFSRAAASCTAQCPDGTGIYEPMTKFQTPRSATISTAEDEVFNEREMVTLSRLLGPEWSQIFVPNYGDSSLKLKTREVCLPCAQFKVPNGNNKCVPCNSGSSDRATLNSLGNSFAFSTRCIPDICPWPYVVVAEPLWNEHFGRWFLGNSDIKAWSSPDIISKLTINGLELCGLNVHLGGTNVVIAVIAVVLLGTYVVAIFFAAVGKDDALTSTRRRKLVLGMLMTTVSPAIDFVSDLMYIVSTMFYNLYILIVTCSFFLLPMLFFWRMLMRNGIHFSFYIGKPPAFAVMEKYDNIPKALMGLAGYFPLYIINLPVSLPLFLVGHVLYCCKVFPISRVSNMWLKLYTRSDKHASNDVILLPLLQESIFEEMLTESVPQMVIQIVNNTFTNVWSPLSYFSTAMSGIMILNGIWRLVYYRLYLKIAISAIPNDLSQDIFKLSSVIEGENSLAKSLNVKVAPQAQLEMSSIVSAMTESDEFTPLIQRHISVAAQELRSEMATDRSGTATQLSSLRSDIEIIKTQLQEIMARSNSSSSP